ncbi:MAG: phosphate ABC transporter permease PstA [Fusobacteria bacterium]|nr:phosphate ABC transporter permease PstA [Fusobacteriota bacterium]
MCEVKTVKEHEGVDYFDENEHLKKEMKKKTSGSKDPLKKISKKRIRKTVRKKRILQDYLFTITCYAALSIALLILLFILGTVVEKGLKGMSWTLFFENLPAIGMSGGGIKNAIIGSILVSGVAIIIATPIGVLAATYLTEFPEKGIVQSVVRFLNDILLSVPSIIIGLFIFALVVKSMGAYSVIAGILSLLMIAVPMIVRTSEDVMRSLPPNLREAAVSLGVKRHKITFEIIYRSARKGIITGIILALSRIAGETAPLLFTMLSNQFSSYSFFKPMANLPVVMYQYAMSPYENSQNLAWAAALVVTVVILGINLFIRGIFNIKPKKIK